MTRQEYEKAVQYIYSMLRDGVVKPGDRLPTERAIAETLGISRNSTREALSVLLARQNITDILRPIHSKLFP